MSNQIKVGDKVHWVSQAQGYITRKTGVVYEVVPSDGYPSARAYPGYRVMFSTATLPRGHESYLVEVQDSKTGRGKPKLYWPMVKGLRRVG